MFANATAMMTATQSQLCFAYANRNYVPKGNAVFVTFYSTHKENYYKNHCERSVSGVKPCFQRKHFAYEYNEYISRTSKAKYFNAFPLGNFIACKP